MLTISSRIACAILALGLAGTASAQWQWLDDSGRKVYSDTPPPTNIPQNRILKAPKSATPANSAPAAAAQDAATPEDGATTGEDAELKAKVDAANQAEQQARAKEIEEAQKKNEEIERKNAEIARSNEQTRQSNCNRAKQRLAQLAPGQRVAHVDAQGNRGYMNDATREAERQQVQREINENCN